MPWVFDNTGNGNGRRRSQMRANANSRRTYRTSRRYDNGYDDTFDEVRDDEGGGTLYDFDGTRVRVVVQSPRDMLPPYENARDYANVRRRARF